MSESSRASGASSEQALMAAREALAATPSGLLTDFDGTISPVVADPALARLVEGADGALASLARRLAVVAVITGRGATAARRMLGVSEVLVVGNHGVEWLDPGQDRPTVSPEAAGVEARVDALLAILPTLPGIVIEHKGMSATVHYRRAADPAETRASILSALTRAHPAEGEIREGRMAVELRPGDLADKGDAARAIIERHRLRGVVVMGDDLTDLDMFTAVAELRAAGRLRAAIIGVGGADRDVPREVMAAADVILEEPADAAALLAALSEPAPPGPPAVDEATR